MKLRDAAEIAYSEMALAVQDLVTDSRQVGNWMDRRSERLAKAADDLRAALDTDKEAILAELTKQAEAERERADVSKMKSVAQVRRELEALGKSRKQES